MIVMRPCWVVGKDIKFYETVYEPELYHSSNIEGFFLKSYWDISPTNTALHLVNLSLDLL